MDNGSDLSQRVLRAAKKLFFERGYASTQLRAIASEAGTSESGILRVYRSKSGLLRAVYASCWADLNARVDEAMGLAEQRDPDPRNLLLELTRTVLETYQADPLLTAFLLGHFGNRETAGLTAAAGVDPSVDGRLRDEYHRYLRRIDELCGAIAGRHPELEAAGVGAGIIGEFATSIIYGVQTSWHMAAQEGAGLPKPVVTIPEVLAALRFFLYPGGVDAPACPHGR